jgi:serine/threonine protein kinase
MKVTRFNHESTFIQALLGVNHTNLARCLGSWTYDSDVYMLYERAHCDLETFMLEDGTVTAAILEKQLCGLADALLVIHSLNRSKNDASKRLGCHNNLKFQNILVYYENEQIHSFRISDFCCAETREYDFEIDGKSWSSYRTTDRVSKYNEAPESKSRGTVSQPFDLWSLGCIYLEILVWFIDGDRVLDEFREDRGEETRPEDSTDIGFFDGELGFYNMVADGPGLKPQLCATVLAKIVDLLDRFKGPLRRIVDLVPLLLELDPEKRLTAEELVDKLKTGDAETEIAVPFASKWYQNAINTFPVTRHARY